MDTDVGRISEKYLSREEIGAAIRRIPVCELCARNIVKTRFQDGVTLEEVIEALWKGPVVEKSYWMLMPVCLCAWHEWNAKQAEMQSEECRALRIAELTLEKASMVTTDLYDTLHRRQMAVVKWQEQFLGRAE